MFVVLLLSGLAELVTKLYEAAVKKVPNSEEYHSHLFMAYARVGEYKKMQQVLFLQLLRIQPSCACLIVISGTHVCRAGPRVCGA